MSETGKHDQVIEKHSSDKIGTLVEAFNEMNEEIHKAHTQLEHQVEERTAELKLTNKHLHEEIAERKETEQALRDSEDRFRRLSESAFEGIFIHEKGKILDANERFARMVGYDQVEDVIGLNGLRFINKKDRRSVIEKVRMDYDKPIEILIQPKEEAPYPVEAVGGQSHFRGAK